MKKYFSLRDQEDDEEGKPAAFDAHKFAEENHFSTGQSTRARNRKKPWLEKKE